MKAFVFSFSVLLLCFYVKADSPSPRYPFEYREKRSQLIEQIRSLNFSHHIRLSSKERKVNARLRALLKEEFQREAFLPEQNFLKAREEIIKSPLYSFLQTMPKGAILHVHVSALGDFEQLVQMATYRPDCYIYIEGDDESEKEKMLISEEFPGRGWKSVQELREQCKDVKQFDQKIYESFTLNASDLDLANVWDKFQRCFHNFMGLFSDLSFFKAFIKDALLRLIKEDRIQHVELRNSQNNEEYIKIYLEILEEIQKTHPRFTMKIINHSSRNQAKEQILQDAKHTLQMKKKYPKLIAGFDIAAEEDAGHSTLYYIEELLNIQRLAKQENISFPYFLHNGETDWPLGNYSLHEKNSEKSEIPYNENMYDVLLLKSKRVGHALSLIKNPFLMKKFKEADIALEVCPISNQILGYVDDMRNHPALSYLNAGLAVTINPDDPGLFGYQGVSADYWEACLAWQLDLRALKKLIINSIAYSSLDSEEKETAFNEWQKQWDIFIENNS